MDELIKTLIDKEWELFQDVNGSDRVSCQNDRKTFVIMRKAQYRAWSREALTLYAADLDRAIDAGRSIVREKYIRMMRSTAPDDYEKFMSELPEVSAEKTELVKTIWAHLAAQTEKMRNQYPFIALVGRPLYAEDERHGWPSVETYQTCELLTYSEETLRALLAHVEALETDHRDFAWIIQENTMLGLGFPDMDTAEKYMMKQTMDELGIQFGGGSCCCGS